MRFIAPKNVREISAAPEVESVEERARPIVPYNPEQHHRRSIRLQEYDYSQAGAYYVTICVRDKRCLFGEVVEGQMVLNEAG